MAINNVVLVGRITKDPEVRKTNSGISACTFNLAVDRNINKKTAPEGTVTVDFLTCVCYRGTADFMGQYVHKGDLLSVEGRLQNRNYEKDGRTVYVTEVIVNRLNKEERRSATAQPQEQAPTGWIQPGQIPNPQPQPVPQYPQQNTYPNQPPMQQYPQQGQYNPYPPQSTWAQQGQGFGDAPQQPDGKQLNIASDDLPF